ncbi:SLAC1 anion channel family protein [Rhodobium orientis]|uniref:C4-dicarboxylate ABC transporter n=1 Tax=Rhodobium orientis TaxID=34017 RepID=A0A327JU24_9HYPH|nr:SLAC1 anion channel family protein [Rhodobium orientis]MBK5950737.1 C4-dicarboxylate ABC transporter [Rhodobium orientis]RAI29591.1 C4-dicarboxylate ABC transporter [Rhodobium orientis]
MDAVNSGARLIHFPVSFFAVVMGLSGLTLAVERMEATLGVPHVWSLAFVVVSVAAFIIIGAFYLTKLLRHRAAVIAEWNHPVRIAFFPAITIGLILLATALRPYQPDVARILWFVGTAGHLGATLAVISTWIGHRSFETPHINPAWFIPAVGNVIVPVAGTDFGYTEICWFFFAIGLVFWVILLVLVFNRLIFHHPLPERLYPTLVILIAPPAVAFLAYMKLTGGPIDAFARILYYAGLFFTLLVTMQLDRLARLPFAMSWWAYSFPMAAITIATWVYAKGTQSGFHTGLGFALFAVLSAIILILLYRTTKAIAGGEICQPE